MATQWDPWLLIVAIPTIFTTTTTIITTITTTTTTTTITTITIREVALGEVERRGRWLLVSPKDTGSPLTYLLYPIWDKI